MDGGIGGKIKMTDKQLVLVAHSCAGIEVVLHLLEHEAIKEEIVNLAIIRQLRIAAHNLNDALGLIAPPIMIPTPDFRSFKDE